MKTLSSVFLLILLAFTSYSQNFEGTIKWVMKMEITDPALKVKMAEGQQKMNDPANQAKMKEMEAKMNDPQMKALMDANPQIKTQMENAMKMMQGGSPSDMMPQGFTIKIKGSNSLTKMEGGPMAMEVLYVKDKDQSYRLDRQSKTYSSMGGGSSQPGGKKPTVTKTSESTKILGYKCTKFVVELIEGNRKVTQSIWATTEIKDIDAASLAKQSMGRGQSIFYEGMEGIPLRIESGTAEGNMTMEVIEIKKESLNQADFTIPAGFKEGKPMFGR